MFLWIVGIHLAELLAIGIFLLVRKNRALEKVVIQQQEHVNALDFLFSRLSDSLSNLDERVWVEGDEELGEVFQNIKEIKDTLDSLYK